MRVNINDLKKEMDEAHRKLIESDPQDVSKRLMEYIDAKERYFLALKDLQ
ncbi:MAG TPA: hypothetical protein VIL23_01605 [Clostridia bacterium]